MARERTTSSSGQVRRTLSEWPRASTLWLFPLPELGQMTMFRLGFSRTTRSLPKEALLCAQNPQGHPVVVDQRKLEMTLGLLVCWGTGISAAVEKDKLMINSLGPVTRCWLTPESSGERLRSSFLSWPATGSGSGCSGAVAFFVPHSVDKRGN